jgi:hypothetical protein
MVVQLQFSIDIPVFIIEILNFIVYSGTWIYTVAAFVQWGLMNVT